MLWPVPVCSRNADAQLSNGLEVMVKCGKKPSPRPAVLSRCLCSYVSEQGSTLAPSSYVVTVEAVSLLPNNLQEGELFLPVGPRESSVHAACYCTSTFLH